MADLKLRWDSSAGRADLVVVDGDLATGDDLESSLVLMLFVRRGSWWGNRDLGSRLHTLIGRPFHEVEVLRDARKYCIEATRSLVESGVAESVDVEVKRFDVNSLAIRVSPIRGGDRRQFDFVWGGVGDGTQ